MSAPNVPHTLRRTVIFVQKNDFVGLLHRLRDGFAVKRAERAQIDDLDLDSVFGQDVSGLLRGVHHRSISNDAEVAAFAMHAGLADRHGVVFFGTSSLMRR